ncbi:Hypothetical_protein [Hexamita inflata]|uniref:Hypothetical_protein n=1 Tax=Hexamita inflata TaxID=28002 RepID=A0AA86V4M6_9EUKA|nr:Hypothetical protein HINF_LOCUS63991 [Hexamita inflata]
MENKQCSQQQSESISINPDENQKQAQQSVSYAVIDDQIVREMISKKLKWLKYAIQTFISLSLISFVTLMICTILKTDSEVINALTIVLVLCMVATVIASVFYYILHSKDLIYVTQHKEPVNQADFLHMQTVVVV